MGAISPGLGLELSLVFSLYGCRSLTLPLPSPVESLSIVFLSRYMLIKFFPFFLFFTRYSFALQSTDENYEIGATPVDNLASSLIYKVISFVALFELLVWSYKMELILARLYLASSVSTLPLYQD